MLAAINRAFLKPAFFSPFRFKATNSYRTMVTFDPSLTFNHTSLRIKDPKVSVEFYKKNFGLTLFQKYDAPEKKFSLYFLALEYPKNKGYGKPLGEREGVLELTYNYGTENDSNFKVNNGNEEPNRGFGHICFSVDNINAACDALESSGVKFQKKLTDGRQKDIAFALDPDGYWIELISNKSVNAVEYQTEFSTYKFNHSMIRIKDPKKSLDFYQNVLGMKIVDVSEHPNAKFTLYFLGYENDAYNKGQHRSNRQGLLELTHNWGTENDLHFAYHNGNTEPQGFGHIGVAIKDAGKFCQEIEDEFPEVEWALKYNKGYVNDMAFLKDPDGYWIEVFPTSMMANLECPGCSGELGEKTGCSGVEVKK